MFAFNRGLAILLVPTMITTYAPAPLLAADARPDQDFQFQKGDEGGLQEFGRYKSEGLKPIEGTLQRGTPAEKKDTVTVPVGTGGTLSQVDGNTRMTTIRTKDGEVKQVPVQTNGDAETNENNTAGLKALFRDHESGDGRGHGGDGVSNVRGSWANFQNNPEAKSIIENKLRDAGFNPDVMTDTDRIQINFNTVMAADGKTADVTITSAKVLSAGSEGVFPAKALAKKSETAPTSAPSDSPKASARSAPKTPRETAPAQMTTIKSEVSDKMMGAIDRSAAAMDRQPQVAQGIMGNVVRDVGIEILGLAVQDGNFTNQGFKIKDVSGQEHAYKVMIDPKNKTVSITGNMTPILEANLGRSGGPVQALVQAIAKKLKTTDSIQVKIDLKLEADKVQLVQVTPLPQQLPRNAIAAR